MVKKSKLALIAVAVMSAMFACTKAEISETPENVNETKTEGVTEGKIPMTIIAGVDENDGESTKLLLNNLNFNWEQGDEVAIIGFSNADGTKFDPSPYVDKDHIFPSDLVSHKYVFTAANNGNKNVPFTGIVDKNVTLLYAVYPASALHDDDYIAESTINDGVGYGGKIHYKNTTDGNIDGDAILVCNFLKRGKWQFSCPSTIFKINIEEELGVTDILFRRDNCQKDQGIVGTTTMIWYREKALDKTTYEGHLEAASSGNEYNLRVTRDGNVISGDVYFVTRHVGQTGVAHLLKFETQDGKVGFASKTFATAPGSNKLVDLGKIDKNSKITWYDTEVIDYQFLNDTGSWIGGQALFGEYVDCSTSGNPEALVFRGNDHDLALVSNGYTLRLHTNKITSATAFGGIRLNGDDLMGPTRFGFPAIKGMKLYQADVTYHDSYKATIVDENLKAISVSRKDGAAISDKTLGTVPAEADAKNKTYTYDLLGTAGAGWGGTEFGKMYWLQAVSNTSELRISGIKLHYIGEKSLRADCVKTLDGKVFNTNLTQADVDDGKTTMLKTITMRGQFVPKYFTDINTDYQYSFEYKTVNTDNWTEPELSNLNVSLDTETGIATFSADADVPTLDFYEFRAKVRVNEDTEWNCGTAEMATLALDFVSNIVSGKTNYSLCEYLTGSGEMIANARATCPFTDPGKTIQESEHIVSPTYHGCFSKWDESVNNVVYDKKIKGLTYGTAREFETYTTFGVGPSSSSNRYTGIIFNSKPTGTAATTYPGFYFDDKLDYSFWIKLPALTTRRLDNVKVNGDNSLTYSLAKNTIIGDTGTDSFGDLIGTESKAKTQVTSKTPSISCYHKGQIDTEYYLIATKNGTTKPQVKIFQLEISYK